MPYIIAAVVLVIGAVAFTVMQTNPTIEEEVLTTTEEMRPPQENAPTDETTGAPTPEETPDESAVSGLAPEPTTDAQSSNYADGTYTVQTSYFTPRRTEHVMDITLTLANGVVTDASILWDGEAEAKTPNHSSFDEAYKEEVVGQPLDAINLSRVGGASLTTEAFNEAVDSIQQEASVS
jgi:hypothetical protein